MKTRTTTGMKTPVHEVEDEGGEDSEDSWSPSPIPEDPGGSAPHTLQFRPVHPAMDEKEGITVQFMKDLIA